jgi:hypothetical protein
MQARSLITGSQGLHWVHALAAETKQHDLVTFFMTCCCFACLQGCAADLSLPEQRQQLLQEVRMGQKGHTCRAH